MPQHNFILQNVLVYADKNFKCCGLFAKQPFIFVNTTIILQKLLKVEELQVNYHFNYHKHFNRRGRKRKEANGSIKTSCRKYKLRSSDDETETPLFQEDFC